MKKLFLFVACVGVVAFACYTLPEAMHRVRVVECYKAQEICTKYWNAHGGHCAECETMKQCEKDGIK